MSNASAPERFYAWWRAHTTKWGAGAFFFLFAIPALSGLIGRLTKQSAWLNDWNAVVCGGLRAAARQPFFGAESLCTDFRAAPFVYPGWVARAAAPLVEALGVTGADLAYAALLAPAMAFLFWLGFLRALPNADWRDRMPVLALITGSAAACGNISYPLHALIALAALTLPRGRLFFIAAVAAACAVKPFFATFLVLLLLEQRPLWRRLLDGAWSGALCIGVAAFAIYADPEYAAWSATVNATVLEQLEQSVGFFGWWRFFGAPAAPIPMFAAYALYAAALILAALAIAKHLDWRARLAFGLGLAALLNPRLMDYDLFLLAPAPVLAAAALRAHWPAASALLWGGVFFTCVGALVLNAADQVPLGLHLGTLLLALIVLCAGIGAMRPRASTSSPEGLTSRDEEVTHA
ncbi:MAG: hypothetical protein NW206_11165 [Hyphomonadaceae bacterium]|nr:hypothetical protein [Hyphomonadaceae bacterium]